MTMQYFEGSCPQGQVFENRKKCVFKYDLGESVCQILGLYRFSFSQEVRAIKSTRREQLVGDIRTIVSPSVWCVFTPNPLTKLKTIDV